MRKATPGLPLRHAVVLGLLHGPTELLPVSSSGHTTLLAWLARWPYDEFDPRMRKSFEVALHAGTAAALLIRPPSRPLGGSSRVRGESESSSGKSGARLVFLAAAITPPALAGYALGGQIERRLGTPATIAVGLLAGSAAMIAAELDAHRRRADSPSRVSGTLAARASGSRSAADAGSLDGITIGVAQSLALMPGVSRSGASLAAARARGFSRMDADRLSWTAGLPVITGAALLKGSRLAREGVPRGLRLPLATGTASAFLSTLVSARVLDRKRRTALLPLCAVHRVVLAALVIRRMRDNTREPMRLSQK